jgi:hypothetical protein
MRMELDNMSLCESESRQDCVFLCQAELAYTTTCGRGF